MRTSDTPRPKPGLKRLDGSRSVASGLPTNGNTPEEELSRFGKHLFQGVLASELDCNPGTTVTRGASSSVRTALRQQSVMQLPYAYDKRVYQCEPVRSVTIPYYVNPGDLFQVTVIAKYVGVDHQYPELQSILLQCPTWCHGGLQVVVGCERATGLWKIIPPITQNQRTRMNDSCNFTNNRKRCNPIVDFTTTDNSITDTDDTIGSINQTTDESTSTTVATNGGTKVEVFSSALVGAIVAANTLQKVKVFRYFKIHLQGIKQVFQDLWYSWNKEHSAAKRIYGPTASAKVVRTTIKMEHLGLYRKGIHRTKTVFVQSSNQLIDILDDGTLPRLFTYVIVDDGMFCSETGVEFSRNYMSKHAVHAKAASEVRYAGEFWISRRHNSVSLILDNNSGTFTPCASGLVYLVKLFKLNFPEIDIHGVSVTDPRHKILSLSRETGRMNTI